MQRWYVEAVVTLWTNIRLSAGLLARPIMLLAIALQLILPAVALRAMEHARSTDPAQAQICGVSSVNATNDQPDDRSRAPHDCGICVVCQVGTGAVALADQTGVHPPNEAFWLITRQPARAAPPRGPPVFRAHARSPPVLS
jgi:hypothetical protein